MPTLEILSGHNSGHTFSFSEEAKIGKDDTCLVKLTDPGVSRFHARISKANGAVQIEDLGSSNGTYVNFKKRGKGETATLSDMDIVFFGRTVCKFWMDAPPEKASANGAAGGAAAAPLELLRSTVPVKNLHCPSCKQNIESALVEKIKDAERVEVIRRLRLQDVDPATLQRLLAQAKG